MFQQIVEFDEGFDTQLFFMYVFMVAIAVLLLFLVFNFAASKLILWVKVEIYDFLHSTEVACALLAQLPRVRFSAFPSVFSVALLKIVFSLNMLIESI